MVMNQIETSSSPVSKPMEDSQEVFPREIIDETGNKLARVNKIKAVNINTNQEIDLENKLNYNQNRCLFIIQDIECNGYLITLRIDFQDIAASTKEPMLNADIWEKTTLGGERRPRHDGKEGNYFPGLYEKINPKKDKRNTWHWTEKTYDEVSGIWLYKFNFKDIFQLDIQTHTFVTMPGVEAAPQCSKEATHPTQS